MIDEIESLASGECRWIGRHDIHAYCRAPLHHEPTYCVACPDAGVEYGRWVDAPRAAKRDSRRRGWTTDDGIGDSGTLPGRSRQGFEGSMDLGNRTGEHYGDY